MMNGSTVMVVAMVVMMLVMCGGMLVGAFAVFRRRHSGRCTR
jgi:hypothetical protein